MSVIKLMPGVTCYSLEDFYGRTDISEPASIVNDLKPPENFVYPEDMEKTRQLCKLHVDYWMIQLIEIKDPSGQAEPQYDYCLRPKVIDNLFAGGVQISHDQYVILPCRRGSLGDIDTRDPNNRIPEVIATTDDVSAKFF